VDLESRVALSNNVGQEIKGKSIKEYRKIFSLWLRSKLKGLIREKFSGGQFKKET
jgi:hypothetical protein